MSIRACPRFRSKPPAGYRGERLQTVQSEVKHEEKRENRNRPISQVVVLV